MLRIDKENKRLISFGQLTPAPLPAAEDLRNLVSNSAREFFGEFGEELFVISGVRWPEEAAQVRADVVAVDRSGQVVAVLFPHGGEASALARAIASLGILAGWKPADFVHGSADEQKDARAKLAAFLQGDVEQINRRQRAVLVSGSHDASIMTATKWLREQNGLDIRCIELSAGVDPQNTEFLSCSDPATAQLPVYQLLQPARPAPRERAGNDRRYLPSGVDRRKQLRTLKYDTHHLKLGDGKHELPVTHLIDVSEKGLGAHTKGPLPVGSYVTVAGDLHGSESAVKLEGRARVAHCEQQNGAFRIGLSFEEIRCQDLY